MHETLASHIAVHETTIEKAGAVMCLHSLVTLMCCAMEELALYIVQESRCGKCKFVCKALRSCSLVIHYQNSATVVGKKE